MTAKATQRTSKKPPMTAVEVADFLRRHPGFFEDHLDLLETLKVPHPCGSAVSLITRQIEALRDKNQRLQQQLGEILHVARDNDALHQRIHRLTLALLEAHGLEDTLAGLRWGLREYFRADFVALRLAQPAIDSPIADLALATDQAEALQELMETGEPLCGQPEAQHTRNLFGAQAEEAASWALIPLRHAGLRGLLAIGSRDADRFQAGLGLLFLAQLGETVSARLASLLDRPA
jgi:uncharacterized protein YigA (DUF484 family)